MKKLIRLLLLTVLIVSTFSFFQVSTVQAVFDSDDILWEYGGEGGNVGDTVDGFEQNYAEYYGPHVKATYESTPVRTGTRSIKMWTKADATTSNYRRMHLRKGSIYVSGEEWWGGFDGWDTNEMYASLWVYIPSDNNIHDQNEGGWVDIFGLQAFWRGDKNPKGGAYSADRWNWRFRLGDHSSKRYLEVSYMMQWFNPSYEYETDPDIYANGQDGRPEYWMTTSNTTICDQWIHLQLYMKISSGSGVGNFKAWIDDNLLADYTPSIVTDPDAWSRWSSEDCEYVYPDSGQPSFLIENYHETELAEMWFFWDDAVASSEKVSESYGVEFDETADIIFEYGAEGGIVGETQHSTFNPAGASGGTIVNGSAKITDEKARTGTKSVILYQPPPDKSDGDKRILLRRAYGNEFEQYISWWAWFPDEIVNNDEWRNLGGIKIRYETTPSEPDRERNGISFQISSSSQLYLKVYNLYCPVQGATSGSLGTDGYYTEIYSGVYLNSTYRNRWVQIQMYMKISNYTDGGYKLWLDGNEIVTVMGYKTDPRCRSKWVSEGWYYQLSDDGTPYVGPALYNDNDQPEVWYWIDDIVYARKYVSSTYGVGGQAQGWEDFEDGFESNDFSNWNGTQNASGGVAPSVTSTYAYLGIYSANLTTDGTKDSYARIMHLVQDTTEIYQRSYIRFEELPDADTVFYFMRVTQSDGTWIASVGLKNDGGQMQWRTRTWLDVKNNTDDSVNADAWHCVEMYFNATTDGRISLWVNGTLMCETTGDYSGAGLIGRVYPYFYVALDDQSSAKTVYHDNYKVDDIRIGSGTPEIFQAT